MTHEDDVPWAFSRTDATAFAKCIVEFEAMANTFQYAFGTIRAAQIALIADAAGQAAVGFAGVFESQVNFVECRVSHSCLE